MEETPLIKKISQKYRAKISDTITVNYFIDQNKTWNIDKLDKVLSKFYRG